MSKFSINKEALGKALSFLQSGLPAKEIMGTDGMYHFAIDKESCIVSIANSKVRMSTFVKCEADEPVTFMTHNYIMRSTVNNFPDGNIVVTTTPDKTTGGIKNIMLKPEGQTKKYSIACMADRDFPNRVVEPTEGIMSELDLPGAFLSETLKLMAANADAKDVRPCFSDICMVPIGGKLTFTSGNQSLMAYITVDVPFDKKYIVQREVAQYISSFTGSDSCKVKITNNSMFISYGGSMISTSMCEGQIPDFEKLINSEPLSGAWTIGRNDILGAINRLAPFTDDFSRFEIEVNGPDITIEASNTTMGNQADETLTIVNTEEKKFTAAVNHTFLRRAMQGIDSDNIEIKFQDNPGLFFARPEGNTNVLWMIALMSTLKTKE